MLLELALKGLLAAAMVWLALLLGRRTGGRAAGLVAAGVSLPSLALLAWSHGSAFVAEAALGALLATPACAAFAATHCAVGRRWPAAAALISGVAAALLAGALASPGLEVLAMGSGQALTAALLTAAAAAMAARRATRSVGGELAARRPQDTPASVSPWICGVAGLISALVVALSAGMGAAQCGFLAGMPIVVACMTSGTVAAQGMGAARQAMHSYCGGLFARTAFLVPVAAASPLMGWPAAMALGLLGAAGLGLLMNRASVRWSQGLGVTR